MNIKLIVIAIFALLFLATAAALLYWRTQQQLPVVRTYEECVARGYPVMESYPEQCRTPEGVTFIRAIEDLGRESEITGEIICLPYKDQNSPHTLECAIGLKDSKGDNYGLKFPENEFFDYPTGSSHTFKGTLTSSQGDPTERYDIKGIFTITGEIKE